MRIPVAPSLVALALLLAAPMIADAQSAPAVARQALTQTQLTGADRSQALAQASAALNRIAAVQGRFSQIAPDGSTSRGDIYLQRPGKMRFAYDAPSPLTIVSDGSTVSVHDRSVRDVSRVPLRSTPLYYVLKRNVSLERDARVVRVARSGADLLVTARDRTGEADGEITLTFAGPTYELRQWAVTDGQRQTTRITLSDVRAAARIDPRLFRIEGATDPTARKGR